MRKACIKSNFELPVTRLGTEIVNFVVCKLGFVRWVDNIRIDLQEVGCVYMDWIGLAQDRDRWRMLVSAVLNLPFREMRGIF